MVQDLRLINEAVFPSHPLVANAYTILTQAPDYTQWYTVLDLQDAFFCIPVHPDSQYLFAFEWIDPKTMAHHQYTWMVLPQGFRDSPHLFARVLEKDPLQINLILNGSDPTRLS